MTASFRNIDYSLRPAKHAERKMLGEIFRHLRPFQPVEDYVYVGFGSVWFTDFALFHRTLGIKRMISFEKQSDARERIESNKPYSSISVDYRLAASALPDLAWEKRHFFWLDYDDKLNLDILKDITSVTSRCVSGTVVSISVQCTTAIEVDNAATDPSGPSAVTRFTERFGPSRVSSTLEETELYGWRFADLSRKIIAQEIEQALVPRNSTADKTQHLSFKQICAFEYQDGAKMTTIVGMIVNENEASLFEDCRFNSLDFLNEDKTVRIPFPKLTPREARQIEQTLPWNMGDEKAVGSIPKSDTQQFARFYRYLPNYAVLEN